jgi:hypothetical protein
MIQKKLLIIAIYLLIQTVAFSQPPQKMSFQAVIRDSCNNIVVKNEIGVRISILQYRAIGAIVYSETHHTTSDLNGLISLQVGTGQIGIGTFAMIDWADGPYFIKTEADPKGGTNYAISGSTELLSVPYALYALNADKDFILGTSEDNLDLSKLKTGTIITININKGLSFSTTGQIIVTDKLKNYFEGLFIAYDKISGQLTMNINAIVGNQKNNNWIVKINGARGYNGSDGINGVAGKNGIDGINGVNGTNGINATNGLDGIVGAAGLTGTQGLTGATGLTGASGAVGLTGAQGNTGAAGLTGLTGTTGLTGATGLAGSHGNIGA